MLAQETLQGSGRDRLEQASRAPVAGVAGACEELGRAFAGFEILHLRPGGGHHKESDQKRHRR
jgi:hypothetical protein